MKNVKILIFSILLFLGITTTAKPFYVYIFPYTTKNYVPYFLQGKEACEHNGTIYYTWKDLGDVIQSNNRQIQNYKSEEIANIAYNLFHEKTMYTFENKIISTQLQIFFNFNFVICFLEIAEFIEKIKQNNSNYSIYQTPVNLKWIKQENLLDFYENSFIYEPLKEIIDLINKNLMEKITHERNIVSPKPRRALPLKLLNLQT